MKISSADLVFWLVILALYGAAWLFLRRFRTDIAYIGFLGLATAGFFWRVLFAGAFIPQGGGDMAAILYPVYHFAQANLRQGIIPLWNPHLYAGIPFVGHIQSGPFYPPNLLLFFLTPEVTYRSLEYLLIAHIWLAGGLMYLFLRGVLPTSGARQRLSNGSALRIPARFQRLSRPAALLGGLIFMFNDFNITHVGNPNMVAVGAWLPLVLLCYHKAVTNQRTWFAMLAGAITGIAYLAGHIQPFLYILFAVGIYALYEALTDWRARAQAARGHALGSWLLRPIIALALYLLFTVAVAGISLVPNVEMSSQSLRESLSYTDAAAYSLPPASLVGILVPGLFGRGPDIHWGPWERVEIGYVGILPLVLAALGLMWRKERMPRYFVLLGLVAFLLALGLYGVVHGWLFLIPGYSQIRVPARFVFLLDFAIAALAAYGFDALLHPLPRYWRTAWRIVTPVLSLVLAATALIVVPLVFVAMALSQSQDISIFNRVANGFNGVMLFVLLLGGSLALLLARRARWLSHPAWALAVVVFVFLDLSALGSYLDLGESDPSANFQHPQAFAFLRADSSPFRIETPEDSWFQWQPNLGLTAGLDDAAGIYNPLLLSRYARYWSAASGRDSALYDLLDAKYLVAKKNEKVAAKFVSAYEGDPQVTIWRNSTALPRAFMVYQSQVVAGGEDAFGAITQQGFDPTKSIVLEGGDALSSAAAAASSVSFSSRSTNALELDVRTDAEGYVFLGDTFYPGWRATIDGQDTPVLRADYLFRAVKVPAGAHHIRMFFDPLSWKIGVGLTVAGVLSLLAAGWLDRARIKPRESAARKVLRR